MTDTTTALGPSWLSSTPDGATVVEREITEYVVKALFDGYFSALGRGRRRREWFDTLLVADWDAPIVKPGALSPERAFAARTGASS